MVNSPLMTRPARVRCALVSAALVAVVGCCCYYALSGDGWREPSNHYDALQISTDATTAQVRKAFRSASLTHHPDKSTRRLGADEAQRRFLFYVRASETLIDAEERAAYDRELTLQRHLAAQRLHAAGAQHRHGGNPSGGGVAAAWLARLRGLDVRAWLICLFVALGAATFAIEYLATLPRLVLRSAVALAISGAAVALLAVAMARLRPHTRARLDSTAAHALREARAAPLSAIAAAIALGAAIDITSSRACRSSRRRRGSGSGTSNGGRATRSEIAARAAAAAEARSTAAALRSRIPN